MVQCEGLACLGNELDKYGQTLSKVGDTCVCLAALSTRSRKDGLGSQVAGNPGGNGRPALVGNIDGSSNRF